jgi:hypothetical protein
MSKLENTLIYFGIRFGILGMIVSFLLLFAAAVGLCELSQSVIFWIVVLGIGGFISKLISKRRWDNKYRAGQAVPCLHCSEELTIKSSYVSTAGSYRYAEIQCPHCKKMMSY